MPNDKIVKRRHPVNPMSRHITDPMLWVEDGKDHINIGFDAQTDIGKGLAFESNIGFHHSLFGYFCNIESFWYYIQSRERDDRLRNLHGANLKKLINRLNITNIDNFRAIIIDAAYQRIWQNDALYKQFKESILPIDVYRVRMNGLRTRPSHFKWLISGLEEVRSAIKEERDPNLEYFMDDPNVSIHHYALHRSLR